MGMIIELVNGLVYGMYFLIDVLKLYPWQCLSILSTVAILMLSKKYERARDFVRNMGGGYIVLDGNFGTGKTRMLANLAKEAKENGRIVLSNFYNGYSLVRWNSKKDLMLLMRDLWRLGEMQNYDMDDIERMYEGEGKARVKEKQREVRALRKRYPNIPTGGFATRIFIAGDEMQNIFFSR